MENLGIDNLLMNEKFEIYYKLLIEWNQKFNLTRIIERDEVYKKHFRDSLLSLEFISQNASVLDVGSGAGFPGIPLKIARSDLKLTMIDSLLKRVNFLNEVIKTLSLSDTVAVHSRIEDFTKKSTFDVVISRAVASLSTLSEYCLPFVKTSGIFIACKSNNIDEEINEAIPAITMLGGDRPKIHKVSLDDETERTFVIVKKLRPSPSRFPRGGNKPRLQPITNNVKPL